MITFFIKENGHESGPFTIEQMRRKFISKDTLVWHAALNFWVTAGTVYELKDLFDPESIKLSKNKFAKGRSVNLFKSPFR